jgi:S-adenosylmethionine:tRNA ribosyltransferase-isomerase
MLLTSRFEYLAEYLPCADTAETINAMATDTQIAAISSVMGFFMFDISSLSSKLCNYNNIPLVTTLSNYSYELPERLIAQKPLRDRKAARMMLVDRGKGAFKDSRYSEFPSMIAPGDIVVLNNTKVFPARLFGTTDNGAHVEIFLIKPLGGDQWNALARPAKRLRSGRVITFGEGLTATVESRNETGQFTITLDAESELFDLLERVGRTPLPPYIKREASAMDSDRERYQTVYASRRGAIAAPTAGLHFTDDILEQVGQAGAAIVEITLHVGYGTFEPVRHDDISSHAVMPEQVEIDPQAAHVLNAAKNAGGRIIAVGTTTTRALEWNVSKFGEFRAASDSADLTITPGYEFKAIDALLTNFHLPKSSLLILVSTFAGRELIMRAYEHAVAESYRFYSYGDCMFIV